MKKSLLMTVSALMIGTLMLTGCGTEKAETTAQTAAETTEAGDSGEITKAAESGKGDVKGASGEITVVSREDGSGTRGAFIELLGIEEKDANGEKMDMTTEDAKITNSTSVMMTTVEGDVNAIGYISLGSLNESVTAVKVDGAEATADNVAAGTYKVQRPFNIATNGTPSEAAQDFINFIMSKEGQAVVVDNGYIAVGNQPEYEAGNAEGKIVVAGSSSVTPVMEKLKEAYAAVNPKVEIEVQQSDSTTGMQSAIDGLCDIGMASRELKDSETEAGLTATVIAQDGIAIIVNNGSGIKELTSEQIKSIYTGEITTWEDIK
ncbi:substrate-binding domain-containing protein [Frisingicoccus sp.]|uniref:substrate-binding domain-containing protein n=1 Tax=Frisingicoccus sp. TaxID=1918627 RepID=UPI00399BDAD4